ncbi:IS21-like element helper ATPase IstB [Actinomadura rupiterrae]|uniref:IS21-like element helper ATPase IstB n=1 Tax=Actinomadura rupiterrae TaxID=559627 RepID=UPI0020A42419|nr:IS21-like element helper ATPase IstB [Actinomadura rupiterrae]MCP2337356.1 DNA replication protein DnaC [Actinomadura rupiterrae]
MATQTVTKPKTTPRTTTATAADLLTPRPRPEPGGAGRAAGRQPAPLPDDVVESITRLKMKYVGPVAAELVATAKEQGWSLEEFLRRFLGEEVMGRDEALRVSRVRAARFEANAKSFASWKAELSSIDVEVQQALITLDWARRKETLVFFGPSGTGKSHLAGALSRHAIDQGLKVRWNTLETLGDQLAQAKVDGTVTRTVAKNCQADIVVIDDIGDLPIDSTQAEAFYRIIDCAYERRSIILTSNTRPDKFDTLMPKNMATAAVDRLMHHAHLIITEGESFRLREAKNGGGVTPLISSEADR